MRVQLVRNQGRPSRARVQVRRACDRRLCGMRLTFSVWTVWSCWFVHRFDLERRAWCKALAELGGDAKNVDLEAIMMMPPTVKMQAASS